MGYHVCSLLVFWIVNLNWLSIRLTSYVVSNGHVKDQINQDVNPQSMNKFSIGFTLSRYMTLCVPREILMPIELGIEVC